MIQIYSFVPDIENSYSVWLSFRLFCVLIPSLSVTFDDQIVLSEYCWIIRGLAAFFWQMLQNVKVKFFFGVPYYIY